MKPVLHEIIRSSNTQKKRDVMREYLQARMLESLQGCGAMLAIAFHGGTSLRFLYNIPRFSEDLDFALEGDRNEYDFEKYLRVIHRDFKNAAYEVEIKKVKTDKAVNSALFRFHGLLYEMELSPHKSEVFNVKMEVDTNPPEGAVSVTTVVNRHVKLNLFHHDKSSLFAGKIAAVLQRAYTKGRDLFDLMWYLSQPQWPQPNLIMLNNSLNQSDWKDGEITEANWRRIVSDKVSNLDWNTVLTDVELFIEHDKEFQRMRQNYILDLLS
jgi:predicted nucleotidyltransferase component of viral defense system